MPESHSSHHRHNMPRARLALAISTALLGLTPGWLAAQDLPKNDSGVINKTDATQVEVIEVKGIRGSIMSAQDLKARLHANLSSAAQR